MKKVVSVSEKSGKYYVVVENDVRIRVDAKEYQRVKRKLSKNITLFLNINEESDSVE